MTTIKQINYRKISRYSLLQLLTFTVKTFIIYIFLSREVNVHLLLSQFSCTHCLSQKANTCLIHRRSLIRLLNKWSNFQYAV